MQLAERKQTDLCHGWTGTPTPAPPGLVVRRLAGAPHLQPHTAILFLKNRQHQGERSPERHVDAPAPRSHCDVHPTLPAFSLASHFSPSHCLSTLYPLDTWDIPNFFGNSLLRKLPVLHGEEFGPWPYYSCRRERSWAIGWALPRFDPPTTCEVRSQNKGKHVFINYKKWFHVS